MQSDIIKHFFHNNFATIADNNENAIFLFHFFITKIMFYNDTTIKELYHYIIKYKSFIIHRFILPAPGTDHSKTSSGCQNSPLPAPFFFHPI